MPGIRHVRHLADVEALQYRKDLLRPGGRRCSGCASARACICISSRGAETVFGRDCRRQPPVSEEQKRHIGLHQRVWQHECRRARAGGQFRHREADAGILCRPLPDLSCTAGERAGQAHAERLLFPDPLRRSGHRLQEHQSCSPPTRRRSFRRNTATRCSTSTTPPASSSTIRRRTPGCGG